MVILPYLHSLMLTKKLLFLEKGIRCAYYFSA